MSPELLLSALVAPMAALVGALGAVALTNRHTRQLENERHARERRELAREVGGDLILAAGEASAALAMTVSLAMSLNGAGMLSKSVVEGLQNQMNALTASSPRLARATLRFRLTFADHALSEMAVSLARDTDALAHEFTPLFPQLLVNHSVDAEWAAGFIKRAEAVNSRFGQFEDALITRLAEPLAS